MKLFIPAAALVGMVLLSSCSSMYRSGQTPDDVYYSPGRASDLVRHHNDDDEYTYTDPDDNYLRQKVQNRSRWSSIDDADYWYSYNRPYSNLYAYDMYTTPYFGKGLSIGFGNSYGFGNYYGFNSFGGYPFWNTFNYGYPGYYSYPSYGGLYGHGFYGGYYPGSVIVSGRGFRSNTGPKPYMGGFTNNNYNNNNQGSRDSRLGSFLRNAFGNGNNTSSNPHPSGGYNNSGQPTRTFTPSSTPSYSPSTSRGSVGGSSGGSSSGSSSRPGRGGR